MNIAFDFLRTFKDVSEETEKLVMKTIKYKYPDLTIDNLRDIFEKGISGEYGKVYKLDPDILLGWVKENYKRVKTGDNYLATPLLNPDEPVTGVNYPSKVEDWMKEANKAYMYFLNGVAETYIHPHIYDRMMLDGKIAINSYLHYYKEDAEVFNNVKKAKQLVLRDIFFNYKRNGYNTVYFVK